MNRKGQAVFFAALFFVASTISFFVILPTMLSMIAYGQSQTTNAVVQLLEALFPFFIYMIIIYVTIRIARSE